MGEAAGQVKIILYTGATLRFYTELIAVWFGRLILVRSELRFSLLKNTEKAVVNGLEQRFDLAL